MAYTKVTTGALGPHIKTAQTLTGEITALKKSKKDKKRLADLEEQFAATAKTITTKANADLKTAVTSLKQCEATIEGMLGQAMKRVDAGRKALAQYKKTHQEADLRPCTGIQHDVDMLYKGADADMDALAVSWNEYRTLDIKLDAKVAKEFFAGRKAIMDRTVILRTKVNKLAGLAAEAESIDTAALEATQGFQTSTENRLFHAVELQKSVDATLKTLYAKNDPNRLLGVVHRWREWRDQEKFGGDINDRRRAYKEAVATGQGINTALSQLRRTIATKKSVFTQEDLADSKIEKVLSDVDARFDKFQEDAKAGLDALKEIATILKEGEAAVSRRR